jgi:hypothetical protein
MRRVALLACLLAVSMSMCTPAHAQPKAEGNGKDFGIAINPVFALFNWYSGEVNIWKFDRTGEINIPISFAHDPFNIDDGDYDLDIFTIGGNYRKFFNTEQEGFYFQGGYHFAHASIDGKGLSAGESASADTHSVLFGVGYRMVSQTNSLFWAFGFGAGRRWGDIEDTDGSEILGEGLALSVEFMKIGYSW